MWIIDITVSKHLHCDDKNPHQFLGEMHKHSHTCCRLSSFQTDEAFQMQMSADLLLKWCFAVKHLDSEICFDVVCVWCFDFGSEVALLRFSLPLSVALWLRDVVPGWGFALGTEFQMHSWRLFILVCLFPALAALIGVVLMPESPRFLLEVRLWTHVRSYTVTTVRQHVVKGSNAESSDSTVTSHCGAKVVQGCEDVSRTAPPCSSSRTVSKLWPHVVWCLYITASTCSSQTHHIYHTILWQWEHLNSLWELNTCLKLFF